MIWLTSLGKVMCILLHQICVGFKNTVIDSIVQCMSFLEATIGTQLGARTAVYRLNQKVSMI